MTFKKKGMGPALEYVIEVDEEEEEKKRFS